MSLYIYIYYRERDIEGVKKFTEVSSQIKQLKQRRKQKSHRALYEISLWKQYKKSSFELEKPCASTVHHVWRSSHELPVNSKRNVEKNSVAHGSHPCAIMWIFRIAGKYGSPETETFNYPDLLDCGWPICLHQIWTNTFVVSLFALGGTGFFSGDKRNKHTHTSYKID